MTLQLCQAQYLLLALCALLSVACQGAAPPDVDKAALLVFRDGVPKWERSQLATWLTAEDMCSTWTGILCTADGWVRNISISGLPFGHFPPDSWGSEGSFTQLEEISLGANMLSGTLPKAWAAGMNTTFPALKVNSTFIRSSSCWLLQSAFNNNPSDCPQTMNFSRNPLLTGTLPPEWATKGAFVSLVDLDLSYTMLTGSLPVSWGTETGKPKQQ